MSGIFEYTQDWKGNITFPCLGLKFRVLTPKDFYTIEYEELGSIGICRLLCSNKRLYDRLPYYTFSTKIFPILFEEILKERIYSVQAWLTIAYYLQGKKWGIDLDWLEKQPIDKIHMMTDIVIESKQPQDGIDMLAGEN